MSLPVFSSASNHLPPPQQLAGRKTAGGRSSRLSMLHLPSVPARSKHPSQAGARANGDEDPGRAPASGRGGGTGRREAVAPSREAARTSAASSSRFRSDATSGTSVSKVGPPSQSRLWSVLVHVKIRSLPFAAFSGFGDPSPLFQWIPRGAPGRDTVQTGRPITERLPQTHPGQTPDPPEARPPAHSGPRRSGLLAV